jgi:large subunit ribosomal protein L9
MDLILLQKVKGLGALGEKVSVRSGYGRNFLVPYGKAVAATATNLAEFDKKRAQYEAKANQTLAAAESRKTQLEGATVVVYANASPEGKLFGSVGPRDIAEAFTAAGVPLSKSEVVMGEGPLRHIGEYEINVSLHAEVQTLVKITVAPES